MFKQWMGRSAPANKCSCPKKDPDLLDRTLDCLQLNETGEIDEVPEEVLLEALGFRPGKRVCLRCRTRFGGPLVAEVEGRHTALGRDVAKRIRIRNCHSACPKHE